MHASPWLARMMGPAAVPRRQARATQRVFYRILLMNFVLVQQLLCAHPATTAKRGGSSTSCRSAASGCMSQP